MTSPWNKTDLPEIKEKSGDDEFLDMSYQLALRMGDVIAEKPASVVLNSLAYLAGITIAYCAEDREHLEEGIKAVTNMLKIRAREQFRHMKEDGNDDQR